MTFQLDTSGAVHFSVKFAKQNGLLTFYRWSDLSPFTQGYVEALLSEADALDLADRTRARSRFDRPYGFSDLAPETLARIIADCEAIEGQPMAAGRMGETFWRRRQDAYLPTFPPLTVQLGDDGKVRFAPKADETTETIIEKGA